MKMTISAGYVFVIKKVLAFVTLSKSQGLSGHQNESRHDT
jgi:hypothetical protein